MLLKMSERLPLPGTMTVPYCITVKQISLLCLSQFRLVSYSTLQQSICRLICTEALKQFTFSFLLYQNFLL